MKRSTKFYLGAGLLALLVLTFLKLNLGGAAVETVTVKNGDIVQTVEDTGTVRSATEYNLYASQSARVVQVPVKTGQLVKRDQPLVLLENLDLAVQINDVRSQLALASASVSGARAAVERTRLELKDVQEQLSRTQELYQSGAIPLVELEKAQLLADTTRQNLSEQSSRLASVLAQEAGLAGSLHRLNLKEQQLIIKSPVDGILLNLPVKQEQVLNPGALLAAVAVPDQLEIKADLLSDDLREARVGQRVTVTAPVLGQKVLLGQVKEIYPQAEEKESALGITQRRVPVIISLQDASPLKPGYEVRVAIETGRSTNIPVVPLEAVRTDKDGQKQVMEVINGRAKYRTVKTGASNRENIEIVSGLASGSVIVRDGSLDIKNNARVQATN